MELTLAIIKPDAVKAKNSGKIIDRIEQEEFNIVDIKKLALSKEKAENFYEIHKKQSFFGELVVFMISGPIIVLALKKDNAVSEWRRLMGSTNPDQADDGSLRKLYGTNIGENATHGSDSQETAFSEVAFFFPEIVI
jgi:nucleoside-diphosphate kinase